MLNFAQFSLIFYDPALSVVKFFQKTGSYDLDMKQIRHIQTAIEVYKDDSELDAHDRQLLLAAKATLAQAYAPYSGFRVAAAVRLENEVIITGANQENAAYPMCLCAERVALAAAHAQYPGITVQSIAITVQNERQPVGRPAAPCGACRQVICETEFRFKTPISIILQGETGEIYKFQSGQDLLPFSFDGDFLFSPQNLLE